MTFYLAAMEDAVKYSFDVINDSLTVKDYKFITRADAEKEHRAYGVKLTDDQCMEISKRVSALKQECDKSGRVAKGGWGCTLKVDGQVYYKDNDFSLGEQRYPPPGEIKSLIDYIVSLSPIPIKLEGYD